jgi:NAD+ synthase (glutamine-hydrolysing)
MCEAVDSFSFDMDEVRRGRTQNTTWRTDVRQHHQENRESKVVSVPSAPADAEPRGRDDMPLVLSGEPFADDFFDPDALESEETLRIDEMIEAILVGLDGYFRKTGAFRGIAVAASGGRDSVLSTLLAWLWSERQDPKVPIFCYSMPTRHNSNETKGLAARFSKILRTSFSEDPIQEQFEAEVVQVKRIAKVSELPPITVQNIQARIRGSRMWNLSNALGLLWLQSGNMTERATGYTTLGGDLMGGYSLIGNLEKTRVNEMLERIQRVTQDGVPKLWDAISDLMNSVASAELADDQQDERDLMPYPVLDEGLKLFVGERKSPRDVLRILREREGAIRRNCPGYDPAKLAGWVEKTVRLFFRNIFKLVQSPQAVHLQGAVDLDRERALQLPAVMSTEWIDFNLGDE